MALPGGLAGASLRLVKLVKSLPAAESKGMLTVQAAEADAGKGPLRMEPMKVIAWVHQRAA